MGAVLCFEPEPRDRCSGRSIFVLRPVWHRVWGRGDLSSEKGGLL